MLDVVSHSATSPVQSLLFHCVLCMCVRAHVHVYVRITVHMCLSEDTLEWVFSLHHVGSRD